MAVRADYAVTEVDKALCFVRDHLTQAARRVMLETGATAYMAIKADAVLRAFHRASRQLIKLKDSLVLQANDPLEHCCDQVRRSQIMEEGRKSRSSLTRAQKMALETCRNCLANLNKTPTSGTTQSRAHNKKMLFHAELAQEGHTAASAALAALARSLVGFPAGSEGGAVGAKGCSSAHDCRSSVSSRNEQFRHERRFSAIEDDNIFSAEESHRPGSSRKFISPRALSALRPGPVSSVDVGDRRGTSVPRAAYVPTECAPSMSTSTLGGGHEWRPFTVGHMSPVARDGTTASESTAASAATQTPEERRVGSRGPVQSLGGGSAILGGNFEAGVESQTETWRGGKLSPEELRASDPRYRRSRRSRVPLTTIPHWSSRSDRCGGVARGANGVDVSDPTLGRRGPWTRGHPSVGATSEADSVGIRNGVSPLLPDQIPMLSEEVGGYDGADDSAGRPRSAPRNVNGNVASEYMRANELRREDVHAMDSMPRVNAARRPSATEVEHGMGRPTRARGFGPMVEAQVDAVNTNEATVYTVRRGIAVSTSVPRARRGVLHGLVGELQDQRVDSEVELFAAAEAATSTPTSLSGPATLEVAADPGAEDARSQPNQNEMAQPDMADDEATAQRIAQEELESQAQEDAMLALRLTAWEEAGREREVPRARRRSRRHAQADLLNAATEAAVARQGDVSEAVRMLQYQEIDENDFEVLLELDEDGPGAGTGLCGRGRGLTEEDVEASLKHETASTSRLSDNCVICMTSYELGDEISVLPCKHAFHTSCIRRWLPMRNLCPTDMQPVVPDKS